VTIGECRALRERYHQLLVKARGHFPDADPVQLRRALQQSLNLPDHDDHRLTGFTMMCAMLQHGIEVQDVVKVLALAKLNLIAQQIENGTTTPDQQ
jgi:hypothetical protein